MSRRHLVALAVVLPLAVAVPVPGAQAELRPKLPDLAGIVKDQDWAIVLGKALFWDTTVGSDGMACASCHYHAGADVRVTNALSPGLIGLPEPDFTFGATVASAPFVLGETGSGGHADGAYGLVEEDFPFHELEDILDRNSDLLLTTDDVVSSAGAYDATLTRIRPVGQPDVCEVGTANIFHASGYPTRQVEPRNTPTTINAAFNHRNFWDGRASNIFSGVGVFGTADVANDPAARLVLFEDGVASLTALELDDSSLASQAVGPPLSNLEMSCGLRTFAEVGRKLLSAARRPLALQLIHEQDSAFGGGGAFGDLRAGSGRGLALANRYRELVERAFEDKWHAAPGRWRITEDGALVRGGSPSYTQMELNFSLFWGVALMLYEATLVSDDSPFDRDELSDAAERGLQLFETGAGSGGGGCVFCHTLPLGTQAAQLEGDPPFLTIANPASRPTGCSAPETSLVLRDRGFFPLGVRPVAEDVGLGGTDPYGGPLSFSRQSLEQGTNPGGVTRAIVDGSFKVPQLRNVALTPPYFHNGGFADLRQVLEFYRRGGNRRDASLTEAGASGDDSGTGCEGEGQIPVTGPEKGTNAAGTLSVLELTDAQLDDIVEFLKALTDLRVQCDMAPFDHPELLIPVGHAPLDGDGDGKADDYVYRLPEVGAAGYDPASGLCIPNAGDLFAPGMQARTGGAPAP